MNIIEGFKDFILFVYSSYGDIIGCILGFLLVVFLCDISKRYSDSFRKFYHLDKGSLSDTKNKDIYIDKDGNWIEVFRD